MTFCCSTINQPKAPLDQRLSPSRMPTSTDSFRTSTKNSSWASNSVLLIGGFCHGNRKSRFPDREMCLSKKQDIGTPKFDGESLVCLVKRPLWGANPSNKSKYDPNSRCPMNLQCQVQIPKFEHSNLQVGGRRSQKDVKKKDCVGLYYHTSPISRVPAFVVPCVSNLIRGPDIL